MSWGAYARVHIIRAVLHFWLSRRDIVTFRGSDDFICVDEKNLKCPRVLLSFFAENSCINAFVLCTLL